jgi:hypothetical protein
MSTKSNQVESGYGQVSLEDIQRQVGHSSIAITVDVYDH